MQPLLNPYSFWLALYLYSLNSAANDYPTLYSSRIDGALLPYNNYFRKSQEVISGI